MRATRKLSEVGLRDNGVNKKRVCCCCRFATIRGRVSIGWQLAESEKRTRGRTLGSNSQPTGRYQLVTVRATVLASPLACKYIPRLSRIRKMTSATAQTMELIQVCVIIPIPLSNDHPSPPSAEGHTRPPDRPQGTMPKEMGKPSTSMPPPQLSWLGCL